MHEEYPYSERLSHQPLKPPFVKHPTSSTSIPHCAVSITQTKSQSDVRL